MITSKQLSKNLIKEAQTLLITIGLSKHSQNVFTKPISSDVIGIVALGFFSPVKGIISINPTAGVRHEPLEKLVEELSGQSSHPFMHVTIGASLGYLIPDNTYTTFNFDPTEESTSGIEELAEIIKTHGYQWMQAHETLEAILGEILAGYRFIGRDAARLRLPAIYYLQGDFDSTRKLVQAGLDEIGTSEGPVSDQYRRFADSLLHKLKSTP